MYRAEPNGDYFVGDAAGGPVEVFGSSVDDPGYEVALEIGSVYVLDMNRVGIMEMDVQEQVCRGVRLPGLPSLSDGARQPR